MFNNTYVTTVPATVEYQSIFEINKFDKHSLQVVIDDEHIDALTSERPGLLEWVKSKVKNPKRAVVRPEPWEEVATGKYKVSFTWKPEIKVPVVDAVGTVVDTALPLYSGSRVKVAFEQTPYSTPDSVGTRLKLKAIQIISVSGNGMSDAGSLDAESAVALFGTTEGFSIDNPNISVDKKEMVAEAADF